MTTEERLDDLEKRLERVEREVSLFQTSVAKKLAEAVSLIQKHQRLRDARVNQALRKVVEELGQIRDRLATIVPPVMH